MSFYKAATDYDVPAINLVLLDPQPFSTGVQAARRTYSANRTILDEGPYIELEWRALGNEEAVEAVLSYFDLDGANKTSNVTVFVPMPPFMAYSRMNGIAHQPEIGRDLRRDGYFFRMTIRITDLEFAN